MRQLPKIVITLVPFYCGIATAEAQPCKTSVPVISSKAALRDTMSHNPEKRLVLLTKVIPGLHYDLVYGTTLNFTKTILYSHAQPYLLAAPASALLEAERALNKKGMALKIYDAYRPFSTTCRIWRLVRDKRYAANPAKGSNHNRGLAVDLTIVNVATGKELDMGTRFDNFTDTAHHDFGYLPAQVSANRKLLKQIMWQHGFNSVPTEWWHYTWRTKEQYDVMDVDFDELKMILKK